MLVFLSLLTLAFAIAFPRLQERAFAQQLDGAVSAIEALRVAASNFEEQGLDWPAPSPPGVTPPELVSTFPAQYDLAADDYSLEWNRWETVDRQGRSEPGFPAPARSVPAPQDSPPGSVPSLLTTRFRKIGSITVYSGDPALLAGLLRHYGTSRSFVRDTTWTLVIPR